jgi:hypothetical protein
VRRTRNASAATHAATLNTSPVSATEHDHPRHDRRSLRVRLTKSAPELIDAHTKTPDVRGPREASTTTTLAPVAHADEAMHLPLTHGEKHLIEFLVEQALKPWMPGT